MPVLVATGRHSGAFPGCQYTADHIPGARLEIFEDSDHAPFYSEAEKFNRVVTEFVNNPLRGLLLEGAASDPSGPADGAFFDELRERVRGRAQGSAEIRR